MIMMDQVELGGSHRVSACNGQYPEQLGIINYLQG